MNPEDRAVSQSTKDNSGDFIRTCLTAIGLAGCISIALLVFLVWAFIPREIYGCLYGLPQGFTMGKYGRIAFVSDRDGNPEIYVVGADGSEMINLTQNPAHDWDPSWGP